MNVQAASWFGPFDLRVRLPAFTIHERTLWMTTNGTSVTCL